METGQRRGQSLDLDGKGLVELPEAPFWFLQPVGPFFQGFRSWPLRWHSVVLCIWVLFTEFTAATNGKILMSIVLWED